MHLGHRRANSYSSSTTTVGRPQPAIPPPPLVVATRTSQQNTQHSTHINFSRGKEERRSFNNYSSTLNKPERLCRGYKGVVISKATPPLVRFSVNPELSWLCDEEDMSRPRSPSKVAWKGGLVDAGVPVLDQAFAAIKEQLALLKSERANMGHRLDILTTGIDETSESIKKRQNSIIRRSPGQILRRIRSLEGRAQSYIHLPMVQQDYPEFEGLQEFNDDIESINNPVMTMTRKRKNSLPSKIVKSVTNLSTTSPIRLSGAKLSKRRSLQALGTVIDNSLSSDEYISPDSTPQSSPKLIRVSSVRSITQPYSKVLVAPCPSRGSQTLYKNTYNTLPSRKSSVGSLSYIYDDTLSDVSSIPDGVWDECSLYSEGSMIFRISSATGQIEKVPRSIPLRKLNAGSNEALNSPTISSPLRKTHQMSMYCNSPGGEEPNLGMILTLTEEPRPVSVCMEPHQSLTHPVPTPKRSSVVLPSIETTV